MQSEGDDGSLVVDYFTFSSSIADHLRSASLVISHAGMLLLAISFWIYLGDINVTLGYITMHLIYALRHNFLNLKCMLLNLNCLLEFQQKYHKSVLRIWRLLS